MIYVRCMNTQPTEATKTTQQQQPIETTTPPQPPQPITTEQVSSDGGNSSSSSPPPPPATPRRRWKSRVILGSIGCFLSFLYYQYSYCGRLHITKYTMMMAEQCEEVELLTGGPTLEPFAWYDVWRHAPTLAWQWGKTKHPNNNVTFQVLRMLAPLPPFAHDDGHMSDQYACVVMTVKGQLQDVRLVALTKKVASATPATNQWKWEYLKVIPLHHGNEILVTQSKSSMPELRN